MFAYGPRDSGSEIHEGVSDLLRLGALVLSLLAADCTRTEFDWAQGENFLLEKKIEEKPDGSVEMHFVSLVNAPGEEIYKTFIDVDHHDQFIEGVTESKPVSSVGGTKSRRRHQQGHRAVNRARVSGRSTATQGVSFRTLEWSSRTTRPIPGRGLPTGTAR
jgi:hypothetical protein